MSQVGNTRFRWLTLAHRTVAEIQRNVFKQTGRNAIPRVFHARNDKETIAAWKVDLNRILHVFNVRSTLFAWLSLTGSFQTELAMNTHVTVSDMRYDVSKIRRDVSEIRGEIRGQVRSVSRESRLGRPIHNKRMLIVLRLGPNQVSFVGRQGT